MQYDKSFSYFSYTIDIPLKCDIIIVITELKNYSYCYFSM